MGEREGQVGRRAHLLGDGGERKRVRAERGQEFGERARFPRGDLVSGDVAGSFVCPVTHDASRRQRQDDFAHADRRGVLVLKNLGR